MFAPSVAWVQPSGTRRKVGVVPFEQRPMLERDFDAEYLAEHHGIPPLDELVLPDGTSEVRAWFPGSARPTSSPACATSPSRSS
jgi:hypothetical protein